MGAKKQKKWGIDINVLSNSNIKKTMSDKALFAEKANAANAMLDELAKARKTKESVPGNNVKKFLKKHKQSRFVTDIEKIKPEHRNAYTQQLLYFTEHPASNLQNLLEMQSARRENFIDQIIKYTDASAEDKQVLGDYLRSLSTNELNRIVDFYEPVLNKGLKRDSDEKFQFIGNDMIQKANKESLKASDTVGGQILDTAKNMYDNKNILQDALKNKFSRAMEPIVEGIENDLYEFYLDNFKPGADPNDPETIASFEAAKAAIRHADNPFAALTSYMSTESAVLYSFKKEDYNGLLEQAYELAQTDKEAAEALFKQAQEYKETELALFKDNKDGTQFVNAISNALTNGRLGDAAVKTVDYFIDPADEVKKMIDEYGMHALDNIESDTALSDKERKKILGLVNETAEAVVSSDELNKFFPDEETSAMGEISEQFETISVLSDAAQKALSDTREDKKDKREFEIERNQKLMSVAGSAVLEFAKGFVMSGGNVAYGLTKAAKGAVKTAIKEVNKPSKIKKDKKKKKKGEQAETFKANVTQYMMKSDPNAPDTAKDFGKALGVKMRDPHKVEKRPQKKSTGLTIEKLKKVRGIYR